MSHEGGHRHTRLQQLLQEEIDSLIRDEVTDPRLEDVRCTRVELSVDYRAARVLYVTADGRDSQADLAKIERAFERAANFLRARVGEALDLKRVPTLSFRYDRDVAAESRATALLSPTPATTAKPEDDDEEGEEEAEEDEDQENEDEDAEGEEGDEEE